MLATTFAMGVFISQIAAVMHTDKVTSHYQSVSCPMGDCADLSYPLSNTHTFGGRSPVSCPVGWHGSFR